MPASFSCCPWAIACISSAVLSLVGAKLRLFISQSPDFSSKWASGPHLGLYGDITATKCHQSFRTPQNNHQMVSPGQQGSFEVTRAASKGGFHVIQDLGGFHVIQPADTRHHHSSHLHQFYHPIMNSGDCSGYRGGLISIKCRII